MRLAFMGSPDFSVPALRALHAAGHEIAAVYAQPPRPAGRGQKETPCPVHRAALELGLPIRTPARVRRDAAEHAAFAALDLDVAVVAAYGLILPKPMLDAPRRGCVNIHASLLPRWRGAAPIQRAILAGDGETGVTIMQMERGLDTGPMLLKESTLVDRKTAGELTDELARMGAELVVRTLARLADVEPTPQPEDGVTYASKIDKAEAKIDFAQPATAVERAVRAFNPAPGAWCEIGGERVKLLAAEIIDAGGPAGTVLDERLTIACGERAIRPTLLQRAGKPAIAAEAALRGWRVPAGTVVG